MGHAAAVGRVAVGAASVALTLAWLVPSAPTLLDRDWTRRADALDAAQTSELLQPTSISSGATADGPANRLVADIPALRRWPITTAGRVVADMGCAKDLRPETLDAFLRERRGPLVGSDNPHIYPIDDERTLWISHDSYVDHSGKALDLDSTRPQIQNLVFLQTGTCFALVHSGTVEKKQNFELGDGHVDYQKFLWPLGGEIDADSGVLWLFWAETMPDNESYKPGHGIARYPTKTFLASYDVDTLERLSFEEAPNSGTFPTYGFAVASDKFYSYLFANSNMLNFNREGGYGNGPHSATKTFLGRVPRLKFEQNPEYWDGTGWSDDPTVAVPISDRFWAENTMQPRYIEGRWISVVKRDGFFGNEIVVDVAENAWGPWIEADRIVYTPKPVEGIAKNSYHPVIAPWSSAENGLVIVISENAMSWPVAVKRLDVYRPGAFGMEWPPTPSEISASQDRPG